MKSLSISILLAIIILLLLSSCGTRHAEIVKKDSIHIKNSYSTGSKIILGNTFTYYPIDTLKSMSIQGIEYKNVIITNDKSIIKTKWNNRNITKTITIEKNKQTEKSDNTILWVLIALIVCGFVFLWFYLPKLKMGK